MCTRCDGICLMFGRLVLDLQRDSQPVRSAPERPTFIPLELGREHNVPHEYASLDDLIKLAPERWNFKETLAARSGYGKVVEAWANRDRIPNGCVRKIILTCAEQILRENGAKPEISLLAA